MPVTILGIRHHGPGSARSVLAELERRRPDAVLIEGPSDAGHLLPLAGDPSMRPPVAVLVHAPDDEGFAAFYPLAEFSPEWVAIRWALARGAEVRFVDLPAGAGWGAEKAALAEAAQRAAEAAPGGKMADDPRTTDAEAAGAGDVVAVDGDPSAPADPALVAAAMRADPLEELARASGDADGERLWDRLVESRRDPGDVFAAVLEAMGAAREAIPERDAHTLRREAAMRRGIRAAVKDGFREVAVVCGAWHAPVLAHMPSAAEDDRLLRGMPRPLRTAAAWVPWTHEQLATESGYGAGVRSPGWYAHLWSGEEPLAVSWMARVAAVFREEGLDASAAHIVEAVRLAEALASLRGRAIPSLDELNEAVRACLGMGSDLPLAVVRRRLLVGEVMGETSPNAPTAPLVADLERESRRLRMRPEPGQRALDLDLRNANDLDRSRLLHRLRVLGVPWGQPSEARGKSGTFHELWSLAWRPEMVLPLVTGSRLGTTIRAAAARSVVEHAASADDLPALTPLVEAALLADLADAVEPVVERIGAVAAVGADVPALMGALPPLARVLRYGNVRGTDVDAVGTVVGGAVERICIGLPSAAASLDDAAAAAFATLLDQTHAAVTLLDDTGDRDDWRSALARVADLDGANGLVAGRAVRLLLDEGALEGADATRRMRLALSPGAEPTAGAAWVEGFLRDSGTVLLHDDELFAALDGWIEEMPGDAFETVLPLLRRTVATFTTPERRSIGERVRSGRAAAATEAGIDSARADLVMPVLELILAARR